MSDNAIPGARAIVATLVDAGVETCFMNPGTSELPFVHALGDFPQMTGVLALAEGVATGAADGYARISGRPAVALLHMGSGLGNGLANLHNARRAHTPLLCIVGSHATRHMAHDTPLQSDIEGAARTVSGWVRTATSAESVAADVLDALDATRRRGGQVATLIVLADVAWNPAAALPSSQHRPNHPEQVDPGVLDEAVTWLNAGEPTAILLGGRALSEAGIRAADRIGQATGAQIFTENLPARLERGAGVPFAQRLGYNPAYVEGQLAGTRRLILAGARPPVSFFAYPGEASELTPPDCDILDLAEPGQDITTALGTIADELAADRCPRLVSRADLPAREGTLNLPPRHGGLSLGSMAGAIAATLPENTIVAEETVSSTAHIDPAMATAARHTLLTLTGGALGQGLPLATGAALAAPDRPILCLEADGSALFTIQALWTQARERLDVTTVIVNNASYEILRAELPRFGAERATDVPARMLDLTGPALDFVSLSQGMGVPARRVTSAEQLTAALQDAYAVKGPHLIEAVVARGTR
ncbi:acetolactate synthase large subunit [Streptomyces sp. NPDC102274]|uniref:acetolactate synthase large subunit n=1 Tax=Streptomyces sp. NPDC102274 TaxID=3366151 RepID=UPI00382E2DF8